MTESGQREAYVAAQIESIHRNLRFLEAVVTSPIGLTTDLRSLREAMPVPGATEERDRQAFHDVSGPGRDPRGLGIEATTIVEQTIGLLTKLAPDGTALLSHEWLGRASKVVDRVLDRLGADVRKSTAQSISGVYVIVDPEHTNGRPVTEIASAALRGGASAIQLRDKKQDKAVVIESAVAIGQACRSAGALLIINDHADLARIIDADGLHVGQTDLAVNQARQVLAASQIIGKSNALVQEALESEAAGADYLGVGAIFETTTKTNTRPAGLETLAKVKRSVGVPVVAIGGINATNASQVVNAGADAICVASAVTRADDPESATRELARLFDGGQ